LVRPNFSRRNQKLGAAKEQARIVFSELQRRRSARGQETRVRPDSYRHERYTAGSINGSNVIGPLHGPIQFIRVGQVGPTVLGQLFEDHDMGFFRYPIADAILSCGNQLNEVLRDSRIISFQFRDPDPGLGDCAGWHFPE
jgi:hypothetical protein